MLKISKRIFLPGQEEGQEEPEPEPEEELSLPVLLLWQAANASREPRVYSFIYCISKQKAIFFLSGETIFFIFQYLFENKKEIILFACVFKIIC